MNISISNNQLNPLEHSKHKSNQTNITNSEKRNEAIQTQTAVKKMVKSVDNSTSDQIQLSLNKTQEMANAQLEQKTALMQSEVSNSSSIASKISVKQRELLQAIAEGDYEKIKSLATELKSLVSQLQFAASQTSGKYSDVEVPEIPDTSNIKAQNSSAAAKAATSAQQVAQAQAQVAKGAETLKGAGGSKNAQAQAVQAENVAKLAKLKVNAKNDQNVSKKAKESLSKAETRKTTATAEKASKLAENNSHKANANAKAGNKPAQSNSNQTDSVTQQENANVQSLQQHNPTQHQASNAYSKTQYNHDHDNTRVNTDDIKAHPEKYASSDVVKEYSEELKMAKSLGGPSMSNFFSITEKVLAKADKALAVAKEIGATDGSAESNSRLADAVSDQGIVGSGDVSQTTLTQHRMLSQQHKNEEAQKETTQTTNQEQQS